MSRGIFLAGLTALAIAAPAIAHAAGPVQQGLGPEAAATPAPPARNPAEVLPPLPLPPAVHNEIPPLPPSDSGYVWDPQTRTYVAKGQAIWVPGHWETRDSAQVWVDGQWMYPKTGYGP